MFSRGVQYKTRRTGEAYDTARVLESLMLAMALKEELFALKLD